MRDVQRGRGSACPLAVDAARRAEALAGAPAERSLLLQLRDRMRLFRTETADFDALELERAKRLGQLYLDVSTKLFPDDFAADLKKLELDAECARCPALPECVGCYRPSAADVFTRDDARVREFLRGLEGDVLDVGAGDAPYAAELAAAVEQGRARYLAVEPDPARAELLRARARWAEIRVGTLDDLGGGLRSFAHVLMLRSWNHLPDAGGTLRSAVDLLAPSGTLLIVDNVAFGLVRSQEHAARAERGPGRQEHHRNDSAAEAHQRAAGLPLALIERRDVGRDTSNQWWLRYRKVAPP